MSHDDAELKNWHNWTDPDFFVAARQREARLIPLFLRQFLPKRILHTRLTLTGWSLIIVSLGLSTAAYTTANNILFLALSLLLSSLILSGVLSWVNFKKLQWNLVAPKHLKAGEVGIAKVELTNQKSVFPSMSICFQLESEITSTNENLYMQQALNAGDSCTLEWSFIPNRRGQFTLILSGIQSKFPFGFLKKTTGSNLQSTVFVWPARIQYTFKWSSGGQHTSTGTPQKQFGQGDDLLKIQRYERGDAPRLIHWKATARMRQIMVRRLSDERKAQYHIQIDPDASQWSAGLFEILCSLVCSLTEDLFHIGMLDSVKIADSNSTQIRTTQELHAFFDQLSLLTRRSATAKAFATKHSNQITFWPQGDSGIAIYVDKNYAGQANG